ncbi:DUF3050 domain-containing protein [Pedobacter duraquae]|uniref:DUF3050 family protein n=1 Tax=Pedobacter duraquae TaxID=425511 RepID=A0A4R6IGT0_9SPHI|nr:DUF3050 domain-containing protein [Pedobacter duraquae]TDO20175.1 Protein of unknown function (DUF3050) [Pedobacter duraquae]
MKSEIQRIQEEIAPLREAIINHSVYNNINTLSDLRIFMGYHVYAVWDFMSLLKALQINLTCVSLPWFPIGSGKIRSLINEIVAGEESDLDNTGNQMSHFELYLDAMAQCGADTKGINVFINSLRNGSDFDEAFRAAGTPLAAQDFVNFTFDVINTGKTHSQASVFTFGREDLIPNMFTTMVNDLNKAFPDELSIYKYYLDRHIEVDGDHHSQLALDMTAELCGDQEIFWDEALEYTKKALKQRAALWNGALEDILINKQSLI